MWVDSHCHLQGLADLDGVLERARAAGVEHMVCVGTDLATSREAVAVAGRHAGVWASVGLHPHDAWRLETEWDGLAELARAPGVVGVGECGFDFHHRHSPEDAQEEAFRRQVRLAHDTGLTLVIHTREAWDATFRVLEDEGVPPATVFHCFTGGPGEAERAVGLGAHVSFSGIVTFANAGEVREAARRTPLERMLVETDSPYLAPHPHRGRPNEPAFLPDVGRGLAEAVGRPSDEVALATAGNAVAVFRLAT